MITLRLRTLLLTIALALLVASVLWLGLRYQAFSSQPRPLQVVTAPPISPDLLAPGLDAPPARLASDSSLWRLDFVGDPAEVQAAVAHRYPGLERRFPDGILLTLIDSPQAPEALRGPYDPDARRLRLGAFHPRPALGQTLLPTQEAWAGCRRDLELGPARQLRCYLYARGAGGVTLDALAVQAWVQALDDALSGRVQPHDPASLPLLTAHQDNDQWTYADAFLSLSPLP